MITTTVPIGRISNIVLQRLGVNLDFIEHTDFLHAIGGPEIKGMLVEHNLDRTFVSRYMIDMALTTTSPHPPDVYLIAYSGGLEYKYLVGKKPKVDEFTATLVSINRLDVLGQPSGRENRANLQHRFHETRITAIVATDAKGNIGQRGSHAIMWKCPKDMEMFRNTTMSKPVVMGYDTFESMNFQPLPGRQNFVFTRKPQHQRQGNAFFCSSLEDFFENKLNMFLEVPNLCIIGGGQIYKLFEPYIDEYIVTRIPIVAAQSDLDLVKMPFIDPVNFIPLLSKVLPATVNGVDAFIQIRKFRRRGVI